MNMLNVIVPLYVTETLQRSTATAACNTASTDVIPEARISEGIGYFGMSQSVASAFGPAIASVAVGWLGNRFSLLVVTSINRNFTEANDYGNEDS